MVDASPLQGLDVGSNPLVLPLIMGKSKGTNCLCGTGWCKMVDASPLQGWDVGSNTLVLPLIMGKSK